LKRTILNDFILKLAMIFGLAFIVSMTVTFFYFRQKIMDSQYDNLSRAGRMIIKDELFEKSGYLKEELAIENDRIFSSNLSRHSSLINSDFITFFDEGGSFLGNDKKNYSLNHEDFFKFSVAEKNILNIFHRAKSETIRKLIPGFSYHKENVLLYSCIYPIKTKSGKTFFVWAGYILNGRDSLFEDLDFFDVNVGFVLDGHGIIASNIGKTVGTDAGKINKDRLVVMDAAKGYLKFSIDKIKYFGQEIPITDFKGEKIGTIVIGKEYGAFMGMLATYTVSMVLIFIISSIIGIFFVTRYFSGTFKFFGKIIESMRALRERKFSEKFEVSGNIVEFDNIANEFNLMGEKLEFYCNKMENEINAKAGEILALNKAIRILDEQQSFNALVDTSVDFLRNNLGVKVDDLSICDGGSGKCAECNFRKLSFVFGESEHGLCIERRADVLNGFETEFLNLFEEVFRINFERISNIKRMRDSYNEAELLSELLISLLKKENTHEMFVFILEKAREFCKGDASYIGVFDSKANTISLKFFSNVNTAEFKKLKFSADMGLGGLVLRERRGFFLENYFEDPRIDSPFKDVVRKEGFISAVAVPIFQSDKFFGVLYVAFRKSVKSMENQIPFLEKLSYAAALALEKETLLSEARKKEEELRTAYDDIVSKRKEINELLKSYKEANVELERYNRELNEQYEIVKKSYEELNRLNKAKDVFLGILSHELKTPLTILKGYTDTLLSDKFKHTNDIKDVLISCKRSVLNLSQIVDDLLDYTRIEMRKLNIQPSAVSMNAMLKEVYESMLFFINERNQKITVEAEDNLVVSMDEKWFKRVVVNLVINAVKFSPNGKDIKIRACVLDKGKIHFPPHVTERPNASHTYLMIQIKDEGIGIPYNELNRVFEKFYELGDIKTHSTSKFKFMSKGLGLGLSFAREIVNLHRGVVFAESPGFDTQSFPGSIFTIYLPLENEKAEDKSEEIKKKSILIVESENDISRFLELVFSNKFSVNIFPDGGIGYLKAVEIKPDLILININLANYDGYELCSIIKEDKKTKDIPVILYSSGVEIFNEPKAERAKANMLFAPLFDIENLLRVANRYTGADEK
jgi:signal transduction histidine kinase/CheY-like chemotaxis protein